MEWLDMSYIKPTQLSTKLKLKLNLSLAKLGYPLKKNQNFGSNIFLKSSFEKSNTF